MRDPFRVQRDMLGETRTGSMDYNRDEGLDSDVELGETESYNLTLGDVARGDVPRV